MRLDKFVSHTSSLSRAKARQQIRTGVVSVDTTVVRDPAFHVNESALVIWGEQTLSIAPSRYWMLNKPTGYVCANRDSLHPTVFDLLSDTQGLHVAGRLDMDTTGLVLLTDDGQWSHQVTSPRYQCDKVYRVTTADPLSEHLVGLFAGGIHLKGDKKLTRPAQLQIVSGCEALLTISEGRYHQVKRMLGSVGHRVCHLHRLSVGAITLDVSLSEGDCRPLTVAEVDSVNSHSVP